MHPKRILLPLLVLLMATPPAVSHAAPPQSSGMGVTSSKLENGLEVLIVEDHAAPVATFGVFYKVGSRNETAGATGSAHLLEHMMFKGTQRFKKGEIMSTLDRLGASWNATTYYDYTNYFETVGVNKLEEVVDLEADRMQNSLIADEERDLERIVVRNELERGENSPVRSTNEQLWAHAFMAHPYHHPVIGWRSDVEGVPTSTLRAFYKTYYAPNNAIAVLVGDVTPEKGLALIQKYFAAIPKAKDFPPVYTVEPPQRGERRFRIQRPGDMKVVALGYKVPPASHPDTVALKLLQLILAGDLNLGPFGDPLDAGISNRLHQALVEKELATGVGVMYTPMRDPGLMSFVAMPRPNVDHARVEEALRTELNRLKTQPVPADELARAKARALAAYGLMKDGTSGRAMLLGYFGTIARWQLADTFDRSLQSVTARDLMRVAKTYFDDSQLTVGWYVPGPETQPEVSESPPVAKAEPEALPSEEGARPAQAAPGVIKTQRFVLDNGLVLLVRENPSVATFSMSGIVRAGGAFSPNHVPVLATLTGEMLTRGTKSHSKLELAKGLEEIGASLDYSVNSENTTIDAAGLAPNFDRVFDLFAETLTTPTFNTTELEKLKREMAAQLKQSEDSTSTRAHRAYAQALYPKGHPYYIEGPDETIAAMAKITPKQLAQFHKDRYQGDTIILAVVGNVNAQHILEQVKAKLGGLGRSGTTGYPIPTVDTEASGGRQIVFVPGKSNVDVLIGHQSSLVRTSADYYAASVANFVLGGSASSMLFQEVRDRKGLTYGIYSRLQAGQGAGPWTISLSLNPANVDAAIDATMALAKQYVEKGVDPALLARAKSTLVGSYHVGLATNDGQADALARFESFGFAPDMIDRHPEKLEAVTPEEVKRVLTQYFHPDRMRVVIAGTYKEPQSAKAGKSPE